MFVKVAICSFSALIVINGETERLFTFSSVCLILIVIKVSDPESPLKFSEILVHLATAQENQTETVDAQY
eukprot:snap_masked-scaffold_13-processed-gene-10.45-mRNA-1 protein AED:0.49 eAED:1.00 QI:0/0/0/1/1/1/2/0/69